MTFLAYKEFFTHVKKNGILIPNSYLEDFNNVESLIDVIIKDFDNHEGISFSSFLNCIVQNSDAEESEKLGLNEIVKVGLLKEKPSKGILFHRDNLLFMVERLISKGPGTLKITGQKTFKTAKEYYEALLLINELVTSNSLEKDIFIRSYPYYYNPTSSTTIYELRLQRYWYIYNESLNNLDDDKKNYLKFGLDAIEKRANLSLKDYFNVVTNLYSWYLKIPNLKKRKEMRDEEKINKIGFNERNINSFYISKDNFNENDNLIKLIEHLSLNIDQFKDQFELNLKRKDPIEGLYRNFQTFFDHPIFKINEKDFCPIDLKFLLEGLCSGFMWHINGFSNGKLQSIKEQYGLLIENYFTQLLKRIFGSNAQKPIGDGNPDMILENEDYIIIIEFTIENYRFASLYSEGTELLKEDLHRILFNNPLNKNGARNKKDKGKFFKLNKYLEPYKNSSKTILPILITENYLGDFDLLDRFERFVSQGIKDNNLENLKNTKPIILNLDDLELFWQTASSEETINQFAKSIIKWEESKLNKAKHHFYYSYFNNEMNKGSDINKNFSDFFNFNSFMKNLSKS